MVEVCRACRDCAKKFAAAVAVVIDSLDGRPGVCFVNPHNLHVRLRRSLRKLHFRNDLTSPWCQNLCDVAGVLTGKRTSSDVPWYVEAVS